MIKKTLLYLTVCCFLSCKEPLKEADLIIHNAVIYSVDSIFSVHQAMAIRDGQILELGTNEAIREKFKSKTVKDAEGKCIFPGFIDAHCHFYGYGKGLNEVDLVGTNSFNEVIEKTSEFVKQKDLSPEVSTLTSKNNNEWIIGRGWDQNDWENKEFPGKERLDSLFPDMPVLLKRIDGHAVLVNQKALTMAGFTSGTKIKGGELEIKNGKLTGILIDNAADSLEQFIPVSNKESIKKALLKAQANCVAMGLTTVDDAGLNKNIIDVIDELQKSGELKMRVYAMLTPNSENLNHYLKNGIYKTDKLTVRAFKFYADGALGSRGACLLKEYSDKDGWKGFLLNDISYFEKYARLLAEKGFQMNTHCIGDSSVRLILNIYNKHINSVSDMRWRIEHAQTVNPADLKNFNDNIIPSVQPTHATSDMYWAGKRLGDERVRHAYAYKDALNASKTIALGTDFPVEDISPFKTFYAAVYRKDSKGYPEKGFQTENALTREETIKGMTIWAAYSNFEEKEKGSLSPGKFADFIILDTDLMKCAEENILKTKVLSTYISGMEVYKL